MKVVERKVELKDEWAIKSKVCECVSGGVSEVEVS